MGYSGQKCEVFLSGVGSERGGDGVADFVVFYGHVEPLAQGLVVEVTLDRAGEVMKVVVERDLDENGDPADGQTREPEPITSGLLRSLPYGEIVRLGQQALLADRRSGEDFFGIPAGMKITASRSGRRGRPEREFAVIAQMYVENRRVGGTTKTLAEQLGLSQSQTRDLVAQTRRKGYLTPTRQGRAGGDLTERAKSILKEMSSRGD